jgi:hypothetical protein
LNPLSTPVGTLAGFVAVKAPEHESAVYMEIVAS